MQEFATVIGSVVTGLFTLLGALLVWRLKRSDESSVREEALRIQKRLELVDLYVQAFVTLEQAIKSVEFSDQFDLTTERSLVNARIRLLATAATNLAYDDAAEKLQEWSRLHALATPRPGLVQAPDPTAKYKEPAKAAHAALHAALDQLRKCMQSDIGVHS